MSSIDPVEVEYPPGERHSDGEDQGQIAIDHERATIR